MKELSDSFLLGAHADSIASSYGIQDMILEGLSDPSLARVPNVLSQVIEGETAVFAGQFETDLGEVLPFTIGKTDVGNGRPRPFIHIADHPTIASRHVTVTVVQTNDGKFRATLRQNHPHTRVVLGGSVIRPNVAYPIADNDEVVLGDGFRFKVRLNDGSAHVQRTILADSPVPHFRRQSLAGAPTQQYVPSPDSETSHETQEKEKEERRRIFTEKSTPDDSLLMQLAVAVDEVPQAAAEADNSAMDESRMDSPGLATQSPPKPEEPFIQSSNEDMGEEIGFVDQEGVEEGPIESDIGDSGSPERTSNSSHTVVLHPHERKSVSQLTMESLLPDTPYKAPQLSQIESSMPDPIPMEETSHESADKGAISEAEGDMDPPEPEKDIIPPEPEEYMVPPEPEKNILPLEAGEISAQPQPGEAHPPPDVSPEDESPPRSIGQKTERRTRSSNMRISSPEEEPPSKKLSTMSRVSTRRSSRHEDDDEESAAARRSGRNANEGGNFLGGPKKLVFLTSACDIDKATGSMLTKYGGKIESKWTSGKVEALITQSIVRTTKFMCSINRGLPIFPKSIIADIKTYQSMPPIDNPSLWLKDPAGEQKYEFSLQESIIRARNRPLLLNYEVYCFKNSIGEFSSDELKDLITTAGGTLINKLHKLEDTQSTPTDGGLIVIGTEANKVAARNAGVKFLNKIEFLVDCFIKQKIDFEFARVLLN